MVQVWEALDMEYGQEQEVVNAVNRELKVLKSDICSTAEYIVKLRNFLPGLEEALKSVDGLEHLQTPDKVNYLIEKFDDRTLYDWEYFKSKSSGRTYDRFFNFILDRYDSCKSTIARQKFYTLGKHALIWLAQIARPSDRVTTGLSLGVRRGSMNIIKNW